MKKNNNEKKNVNRRSFIGSIAAVTGMTMFPFSSVLGSPARGQGWALLSPENRKKVEQRYKIAVCDWMILKRQKLGAFKRTHEIGADGVEVDMGGLGNRPTFDNKLLNPIERKRFLDEAKKYNPIADSS